jgi:HEAT repeat protein
MPHDTPTVVDALIQLCRDTDRDVRDWATFTLGSQFKSDSPSLRAALHERLTPHSDWPSATVRNDRHKSDDGDAPGVLAQA